MAHFEVLQYKMSHYQIIRCRVEFISVSLFYKLRTQVSTQQLTAVGSPEFSDCFVFDLANPFPGKIEFLADIFQAHWMIYSNTKEITDHLFLAFGEGFQGPVDLGFQRFPVVQIAIRLFSIWIFQYIQ